MSWGKPSIVEVASKNNDFSTLTTALKAADLVDAISGDGPFTVFAPTNSAFAKLPQAKLKSLLLPENIDKLRSILTYHVVSGKYSSSDLLTLSKIKTLNEQNASISLDLGALKINQARIIKTDILCSNGIIHVVDEVILPKLDTIPEVAKQARKFTLLLKALEAADLAEVLQGKGPFTVFAPTDQAFRKLSNAMIKELLRQEIKRNSKPF